MKDSKEGKMKKRRGRGAPDAKEEEEGRRRPENGHVAHPSSPPSHPTPDLPPQGGEQGGGEQATKRKKKRPLEENIASCLSPRKTSSPPTISSSSSSPSSSSFADHASHKPSSLPSLCKPLSSSSSSPTRLSSSSSSSSSSTSGSRRGDNLASDGLLAFQADVHQCGRERQGGVIRSRRLKRLASPSESEEEKEDSHQDTHDKKSRFDNPCHKLTTRNERSGKETKGQEEPRLYTTSTSVSPPPPAASFLSTSDPSCLSYTSRPSSSPPPSLFPEVAHGQISSSDLLSASALSSSTTPPSLPVLLSSLSPSSSSPCGLSSGGGLLRDYKEQAEVELRELAGAWSVVTSRFPSLHALPHSHHAVPPPKTFSQSSLQLSQNLSPSMGDPTRTHSHHESPLFPSSSSPLSTSLQRSPVSHSSSLPSSTTDTRSLSSSSLPLSSSSSQLQSNLSGTLLPPYPATSYMSEEMPNLSSSSLLSLQEKNSPESSSPHRSRRSRFSSSPLKEEDEAIHPLHPHQRGREEGEIREEDDEKKKKTTAQDRRSLDGSRFLLGRGFHLKGGSRRRGHSRRISGEGETERPSTTPAEGGEKRRLGGSLLSGPHDNKAGGRGRGSRDQSEEKRKRDRSFSSESKTSSSFVHERHLLSSSLSKHESEEDTAGQGAGGGKEEEGVEEVTPDDIECSITLNDVAGLTEAISVLEEAAIGLLYPDIFSSACSSRASSLLRPPRGVLLYGPPGTGKTLLVRAFVGSLRAAGHRVSLFVRRGGELLSKWVGEAEKSLISLFHSAQKHSPSIIFL
ncbi:aaa family protein, partial [Cystoisospora suis]